MSSIYECYRNNVITTKYYYYKKFVKLWTFLCDNYDMLGT